MTSSIMVYRNVILILCVVELMCGTNLRFYDFASEGPLL